MKYRLPRRSVKEFLGFGWQGVATLSLLVFVTAFLMFRYASSFTASQAIALAAFATLLADFTAVRPKARPYQPFSLKFEPNYAQMLCVLGLVDNVADWKKKLEGESDYSSSGQPSPEKFGFGCTTLTLNSEYADTIVLWRPWQLYKTDYEIEFTLEALVHDPAYSSSGSKFFIGKVWLDDRPAALLFAFGIKVNKQWWKGRHVPANLEDKVQVIVEDLYEVTFVFGSVPIYDMTSWSRDLYLWERPHYQTARDIQSTLEITRAGWDLITTESTSFFEHTYMCVFGAVSGFIKSLPGLESERLRAREH